MSGAESSFDRAERLIRENSYQEAATVLEAAESQVGDPRERARILVRIADLRYLSSPSDLPPIAAFLERSIEFDGSVTNIEARTKLCSTYLAMRNFEALLEQSMSLSDLDEHNNQALLWAASACFFLARKEQGHDFLRILLGRVESLTEQHLFSLLEFLLSFGALDDAQAALDFARSRGKPEEWHREFQAQILVARSQYESALSFLTPEYLGTIRDEETLRNMHFMRGKCLEALEQYPQAHESFTSMNDIARKAYRPSGVPDAAAGYAKLGIRPMPHFDFNDSAPYSPVFLIGFPRSGTTLLESILDTQASIRALSEADAILSVRQTMRQMGISYPDGLPEMSRDDVGRLREIYFEFNRMFLGSTEEFSILLDKLPLNIIHIPLIKLMFPDARFIFLPAPSRRCVPELFPAEFPSE